MPKDFEFDVGISVEEIRGDFETIDESVRQLGSVVESTASTFIQFEKEANRLGLTLNELTGINREVQETYRDFLQTARSTNLGTVTTEGFAPVVKFLDEIGRGFDNATAKGDGFYRSLLKSIELGLSFEGNLAFGGLSGATQEDLKKTLRPAGEGLTLEEIKRFQTFKRPGLALAPTEGLTPEEIAFNQQSNATEADIKKARELGIDNPLKRQQDRNDAEALRARQGIFGDERNIRLAAEQARFSVLDAASSREQFRGRQAEERAQIDAINERARNERRRIGNLDISGDITQRSIQNEIQRRQQAITTQAQGEIQDVRSENEANESQIRQEKLLQQIADGETVALQELRSRSIQILTPIESAR